ncbi:hypothetical protein MLD38_032942 [Melastoma candidum]|uniref:Uncharacterized protein n=1 Tax=Melastoma candidum TaxID=119954 RepID=A0ACB9M4W8_9MYRT|nr:hypothetical protein MLD38_032942 [Melastoma candidum]
MERYQRVEKAKVDLPISENEIRITSQGLIRNYISYSSSLLQERHVREIVLKAMGQAISKTVAIAEIIKKRMPRLHQDTAISSVSVTDVWEPIEEGLVPVEMTRHVSMISITLSFRELNKDSPGYQPPLQSDHAKPHYRYPQQQPRQANAVYNSVDEDSYGRGRGRGRGPGRSWGRGGYGNYQGGNYQGGNYQDGAIIEVEDMIKGEAIIEVEGMIKGEAIIEVEDMIKGEAIIEVEDMIKGEATIEVEGMIKGEEIIKVDTIKTMADIQITDAAVDGAGTGATVVQGMRGAEVEVVEAMAVAGSAGGLGVAMAVATKQSVGAVL